MRRFSFTLILFISILTLAYGQGTLVRVIDSKSREPIAYAHICFQELAINKNHYVISNDKGELRNPAAGESVVAISFMGYKTLVDTIPAGKFFEFELEPDVFDIEQAVVTASFVPQKADKSIYKIDIIDRREIDAKAAANIGDVLSNSINIRLNHDSSLGTGMRMKGLSGNNIKVLIDGVPVIGRMGGNIDLSQLNLYNIDHIEMVEGPMSVVYGSNALAGAINIITKENKFSNLSYTINNYVESIGTYNFDARVALRRGDHSFSLSGARNFFAGYSLDTLRSQHWKPKEQYNGDMHYVFTRDGLRIKYQTSIMNESLWSKGDLIAPRYFMAIDDWFYSMRFNNRIEADKKLNNGYTLNIVGSHSLFNRLRKTVSKDLSTLSETEAARDLTGFNSVNFRTLFGNQDPERVFSFISGIDINYERGEGSKILDGKQEMGDFAMFGTFMINPLKNFSLQPGFRLAHNTKYQHPIVPSVNLKWEISPALNMRASYARGFRAPSLKELYIQFVDINHNIQPNETLSAEYGNNFDLNLTLNTDRKEKTHVTKVGTNLFYNNMHNIIVLAEVAQGLYKYINIDDYNTAGGKLSFEYSYYPLFNIEFGIGTTGTSFRLGGTDNTRSEYTFSPDGNVNITGTIPSLDLSLSAYFKYTGKSIFFLIGENDQVETSSMDSYNNLDIMATRKIFSNRLTLTGGVKNLFNNTLIRTSGNVSGGVHGSSEGSLVGYGRIFIFKAGINIFR